MYRQGFIIIILITIIMIILSCKKSEDPLIPRTPPQQEIENKDADIKQISPHSKGTIKLLEKKIIIPQETKNKWHKINLIFLDKGTKKSEEYIINIHSTLDLSKSNLTIKTKEFLPDFIIKDNNIITSKSNEQNNPALRVEILEQNKTIFDGWLFAKYPDIHGFEHNKYSIKLKEGLQ